LLGKGHADHTKARKALNEGTTATGGVGEFHVFIWGVVVAGHSGLHERILIFQIRKRTGFLVLPTRLRGIETLPDLISSNSITHSRSDDQTI
jgi:hypothetical protein